MVTNQQSTSATADRLLRDLISSYGNDGVPVPVDFRSMVTWLPRTERVTHLIHPYPAKLLMHIPHLFLSSSVFSEPGGVVLDPFAGSGTVLLEAMLAGRESLGAEPCPVSRLVAKVKTTPVSPDRLKATHKALLAGISSKPTAPPPQTLGFRLDYWFHPHVISQLQCIREAVQRVDDDATRDFLWVCFSVCVRKVSLADPRLSVPVRLRPDKYPAEHPLRRKGRKRLASLKTVDVKTVFDEVATKNIKRMEALWAVRGHAKPARQLLHDARSLGASPHSGDKGIPDETVDVVLTSPPYAGAQKYVRSQSLSMAWLGFLADHPLMHYKRQTIGREEFVRNEYRDLETTGIRSADEMIPEIYLRNPLRACILTDYLKAMRQAFLEVDRVLAPGGVIVLVSGNNTVCGLDVPTSMFLRSILEGIGFADVLCLVDDIRSRGLMTKRNKTAGLIAQEWVSVYRKDG